MNEITTEYQNWLVKKDHQEIMWLGFHRKDMEVNTFSVQCLQELEHIIDLLQNDSQIKGLVIYSQKSSGFSAGADVNYFESIAHDAVARKDFLELGQRVFTKIDNLIIPTVAIISGFCLGGGVEFILACRYRIAQDLPETKFALPEVMLGILPGWGGTVRLPRLIGGIKAMDMMLTGRNISGYTAKKMNLIDELLPKRELERAALYYIKNQPKPKSAPIWFKVIDEQPILRSLFAKILRRQLEKKVQIAHYPAPYRIVDVWEKTGIDLSSGLNAEAIAVEELLNSPSAINLARVFLLRQRLRTFGKESDFSPQHIHVEGAGIMGSGIAIWCVLKGLKVTIHDTNRKALAAVRLQAQSLFSKKLYSPRLVQAAQQRLILDWDQKGIGHADVIIEAIIESLPAKQNLFKQMEMLAKPEAVFATNTSSITLADIAEILQRPERLVGIHFFNPVAKMPLVEIVHGVNTSEEMALRAEKFALAIDKLPLPVKDSPGFLVNRMLMPYLLEAMNLYNEGFSPIVIDKAAVDFGMPMGPIELADTVGLDICLHVAENLTAKFGGTVPEKLRQLVSNGELGRKTGKGFYSYNRQGKPEKYKIKLSSKEDPNLADRLINKMIKEGYACLQEQVVSDADLIDAGMIFGAGFAPFRGGPMHYALFLSKLNK